MENIEQKDHLKRIEKRLFVIYGILLLALTLLSILSNFLLKEQAAKQATSLIKRTVERGDFRETVYTLNDAKLDYFDAVVYYGEEGNRLFSLPAQLDPEFASQHGFVSELLYSRLVIDLYFGQSHEHKTGSVLFVFGRFSHVPYAMGIWLFFLVGVIPMLRIERKRLSDEQKKEILLREESSRADLARRVRHDIRSPIGALQIATQNLTGLNPKQQTIIQRAMERISEIVSELELIRGPQNETRADIRPGTRGPQSILTIAQEILQEKRTQLAYRTKIQLVPDFSQDAFFLFANVDCSEFKRALSNIIDNSVDACEGSAGRITVTVKKDDGHILVSVSDNGKGIESDDLPRVTEKGFTKKKTGSGLGLYYAEKAVKDVGGTLSIRSKPSLETIVSIHLPPLAPPAWYVPKVKVPLRGTVVILDDQESTHLCWKMRLDELKAQGAEFTVASFRSIAELLAWHGGASRTNAIYLLDYDLGDNQKTGLDVARELSLGSKAILVTGHFDSDEIQRLCTEERIGLLPKSYLSLVQLQTV